MKLAPDGRDLAVFMLYGHGGDFTEALLEGLGKAGDTDASGMISVQELAGHIDRRLAALTDRTQTLAIETRFSEVQFAGRIFRRVVMSRHRIVTVEKLCKSRGNRR